MKANKMMAVTLAGAMVLVPMVANAQTAEISTELPQARYDEYCHIETIKHLNDLKVEQYKAEEQARIEAQKQAEAEAKAKAEAKQKSTPAGLAQWENEHYADVHERANNSTMGDANWTDAQYYEYLSNLNEDLLMSGEAQWVWLYENPVEPESEPVEGYVEEEPVEEYVEEEQMTEEEIQQEYEEEWEEFHGELNDEWFECPFCGGHEATCGCFEH